MKIAGLDIGSTGCKCTVFDEQGAFLGTSYRDYPIKRSVGTHEVDVRVVMDAVYEVIAEMTKQYEDIAGIGVTSFGETFVMTDETGYPLHTSMLYADSRGWEECEELVQKLGKTYIAHTTGHRPHQMFSISKMMWMKKHRPEVYEKATYIFLMEDYVVYHLTGKRQIDYSLASRTMAFDIAKLSWCDEIFEAAGIDVERMSMPVPTGTTAGVVTAEAAQKTGLGKETQIVSVSHDQIAAAVGAGAFDSSVAVDGAGTVECITPIYDGIPDIDTMHESYFTIVPYVIPGKYVAYAFLYTGGALLQWCINNFAKKEKELAKEQNISVNAYLEKKYAEKAGEDTPTGLLVLPHFAGAATPYMDNDARGAILGLNINTSVDDIYKGCMEGVVYEMYLNMQALKKSEIAFKKLHATGGGAHSAVWMQMKADMLNLPIVALKTVDAGTVGSAMLTGMAIGLFNDLDDAAAHMVEETRCYEPRQEMHEKYRKIYERYERVYDAVRPLV